MISEAQNSPPKLVLTNLRTGAELEAQFNPEQLEEQLEAVFSRLAAPGQGHERLHFVHTKNLEVSLELRWRAFTEAEIAELHRARRQIHSWHYPRVPGGEVQGGGSPTLLLTWPGMLSIEVRITKARLSYPRFNREARAVDMTAALTFEEDRSAKLNDEDVAADFDQRFGS